MTRELQTLARGPTGPISPNGQEIWDWAANLSDAMARADKIATLRDDLSKRGRYCGDCTKWMTSNCPSERNVGGYSRGPSMNGLKCGGFVENAWDAARYAKLQDELNGVLAIANAPTPSTER